MTTATDVQKVADLIKKNNIQIIDLKFTDLPGLWQHFSIPPKDMVEFDDLQGSIWVDGIGFDGSSIRGFQEIQESDMILIPDPATARIDPACSVPTVSILCDIVDPVTRDPYTRDPRGIAKKAEAYLKSTGLADTSYWGPELEFFEHRQQHSAQPRLQAALQGRLLPGPTARYAPGHSQRNGHRDGESGNPSRGAPP